jgi:predicted transcriptional regulator
MVRRLTIWLYLEPLLYSQDYLHLAEISKKLNKNHTTVRQYLNHFEKQGILLKAKKGRLSLYKLNLSNPLIVHYLALAEKEILTEKCEGNLLLKEFVSFLNQNLDENNKSLIFGSASQNIKKANDIDLLITGKINFQKKIKDFESKFNIEVHLINVKSLNLINKHLLISGSESIIKWLI